MSTDKELTPAMKQWYTFKKQYPDSVILFQMGDFYEMFNEDAIQISKVLDIKLTSRGKEPNNYPLAGFPHRALDSYLPRLIEQGYKVTIINQEESQQDNKLFDRQATRIITAGTVTDLEFLQKNKNNYLMAIISDGELYGYSWVDVSTGEFFIGEVRQCSRIIDEIVKINPAEVLLLPDKDLELTDSIGKLNKIKVHNIIEHYFDYQTAYSNLCQRFAVTNLHGFGIESYKLAISAAGAILRYLKDLLVDTSNITRILYNSPQKSLIIDQIARNNLEIEYNQRDKTDYGTILWVIDRTATAFGGRCLRQWIREPLIDVNAINHRLDAVAEINANLLLKTDLRETLAKFIDLERITTKIVYARVTSRDLLALKDSLERIPDIRKALENTQSNLLQSISNSLSNSPKIIELIAKSIATEEENEGTKRIIKSGYNAQLDELRKIITEGTDWLKRFEETEKKRLEEISVSQGQKITGFKVGTTDALGYFVELSNKSPVPSNYTIQRSLKNSTRYRTPELDEWASKLLNAADEISNMEKQLFRELLQLITQEIAEVQATAQHLAVLDVITTFSECAQLFNYVRPVITDKGIIKIIKGRHPVVERILPEGKFVPNDVELGNKISLIVVTGANMGGKSVFLRQTALIVILAQIGCFVPAESAEIGIADRIFTRVGVVDDLTRQQSHFLVEMNETANILNNSTPKSLVLLDEIGRGTDSAIGMALAWAIAKHVYQVNKARALFATHFHDLNKLEAEFEGIRNVHVAVEEHEGQLVFLWKVLPGGTTESYGLEVASLAGIPKSAIDEARRLSDRIARFKVFDKATTPPQLKQLSLNEYFNIKTEDKTKTEMKPTEAEIKAIEIIDKLLGLNVNLITPLNALEILNDLIEVAKKC